MCKKKVHKIQLINGIRIIEINLQKCLLKVKKPFKLHKLFKLKVKVLLLKIN